MRSQEAQVELAVEEEAASGPRYSDRSGRAVDEALQAQPIERGLREDSVEDPGKLIDELCAADRHR